MIVEYAQLEEHTEETTRDVMRLQPTNDLAPNSSEADSASPDSVWDRSLRKC